MENQHRQIKGYRDLDQSEIDAMNRIKEKGQELGDLIEKIAVDTAADGRWVAIAKTHFQQGLMALTRSVAKPDFF